MPASMRRRRRATAIPSGRCSARSCRRAGWCWKSPAARASTRCTLRGLPDRARFQPSDSDAPARASIDAWAAASGLTNIRRALALDAASDAWPIDHADVVVCINMIHISPWASTIGLVRGAARVLPPGGLLFLYGPYRRDGRHTAPSNEAFDHGLCAAAIPRGACAISKPSPLSRRRPASRRRPSRRCRPTTCRSSSAAAHNGARLIDGRKAIRLRGPYPKPPARPPPARQWRGRARPRARGHPPADTPARSARSPARGGCC